MFTLKSAYYIAQNILEPNHHEESSAGDPYQPLWKKIWRMKIPSKIRTFAWRACKKGIPLKEILQHRGLNIDPACPRCRRPSKSIVHALRECSELEEVWNENSFSRSIPRDVGDIREVMLLLLEKGKSEKIEFFWVVAWNQWRLQEFFSGWSLKYFKILNSH
jgi:hypothetical protein